MKNWRLFCDASILLASFRKNNSNMASLIPYTTTATYWSLATVLISARSTENQFKA